MLSHACVIKYSNCHMGSKHYIGDKDSKIIPRSSRKSVRKERERKIK